MNIAYLDIIQDSQELSSYSRLHALASPMGIQFRRLSVDQYAGNDAESTWRRFAEGADVLWMLCDIPPAWMPWLRDQIRAGKPTVIQISPNSLDCVNPLLAHFGIQGTGRKITADRHPERLVTYRREAGELRHACLFKSVETVMVNSPFVIWHDEGSDAVIAS